MAKAARFSGKRQGRVDGRRRYKRQLWGGFCDNQLDYRDMDTGFGGFGVDGIRIMPAIFTSKKLANEQYEDVRAIEVREIAR